MGQDEMKRKMMSTRRAGLILCAAICFPLILSGCAGSQADGARKDARRNRDMLVFVETPLGAEITVPPSGEARAGTASSSAQAPASTPAAGPAAPPRPKHREVYADEPAVVAPPDGSPAPAKASASARPVAAAEPGIQAGAPPTAVSSAPTFSSAPRDAESAPGASNLAALDPAGADLTAPAGTTVAATPAGPAAAQPVFPIPASSLSITSSTASVPSTPQHATAARPVVASPRSAAPAAGNVTPAPGVAQVSGAPVLTPSPMAPSLSPASVSPAPVAAGQGKAKKTAAAQPAPPAPAPITERAAYKAALAAYEGRRYEEGERRFDAFMRDYPRSGLMPNALYWKAECLYTRGLYADAIFVFKDVTARYPKHPKAADALLKTGMSYDRMKDPDNAKLHYRVLAEDYPSSRAARKARELRLIP